MRRHRKQLQHGSVVLILIQAMLHMVPCLRPFDCSGSLTIIQSYTFCKLTKGYACHWNSFQCSLFPLYKLEVALVAQSVKLTSIPSHCGSPSCLAERLTGCHRAAAIRHILSSAASWFPWPGAISLAIHAPGQSCSAKLSASLRGSPRRCDWTNI